MVSQKAILKTIGLNVVFGIIAITQYYIINTAMLEYESSVDGIKLLSIVYSVTLFKNYLILFLNNCYSYLFEWIDASKREKPKPSYFGEFHVYLWTASYIEFSTLIVMSFLLPFSENPTNIFQYLTSYLLFFPLMFCFEVIFDFFHYWAHRKSHYGLLYKYLHKTHHKYHHPTGIITFYQNPIDLVISNGIPTFITFWILMYVFGIPINFFQVSLISVFKTTVEIGGHLGKKMAPICSCPQFIWLPKWLGWELYVEDHDLHHTDFNYNFAKRFGLWDKVFGTYKKPDCLKL